MEVYSVINKLSGYFNWIQKNELPHYPVSRSETKLCLQYKHQKCGTTSHPDEEDQEISDDNSPHYSKQFFVWTSPVRAITLLTSPSGPKHIQSTGVPGL